MIESLLTLLFLILLQAVLGFDNLLYISLESAPEDKHMDRVTNCCLFSSFIYSS